MSIYDKFLDEMSIARSGDYDFGNLNYIGNKAREISKNGVKELLSFTYKGETLYIVKYNAKLENNCRYFLLSREVPDYENEITGLNKIRHQVICAMLLQFSTRYRGLNYGAFRIVKGVETHSTERNKGYGKIFYKKLVNDLGFTLMGDEEQYAGARNLWISLSNHPEFIVDIVDISNAKVIEKNVKLTDALDPRIWTDEKLMLTGTKEERKIGRFRRLVLTKVN